MLNQGREHESVGLRSRAASLNLVTEEFGELELAIGTLCGEETSVQQSFGGTLERPVMKLQAPEK